MNFQQILLTICCVFSISVGQLLFKKTSLIINETGSIFSKAAIIILLIALSIYGFATLFWIYILKTLSLNKAYNFMALSFILVPIGSFIFFNERINTQFVIGLTLIIIGLMISIRS